MPSKRLKLITLLAVSRGERQTMEHSLLAAC